MTLWMVLLGATLGCGWSTPEPAPTEAPTSAARENAKGKARGKRKMKMKRRRRAKAKHRAAAVGGSGDVMGTLVLTEVEEPVRRTAPTAAPAASAEPSAEGGDAGGTPMVTRTKAELKLVWAGDGSATVGLGKIKGTCSEGATKPIGPVGREKMPLWTVHCKDGEKVVDLFILQVGQRISVVREIPGASEDAPATFKPVKRVPLVEGATLKRAS